MKLPVRELSREGIPVTGDLPGAPLLLQGYYKWLREPWPPRDYENAYLTNAAFDAHCDDPAFGYRFISDELERLDRESVSAECGASVRSSGSEAVSEEVPLREEARSTGSTTTWFNESSRATTST